MKTNYFSRWLLISSSFASKVKNTLTTVFLSCLLLFCSNAVAQTFTGDNLGGFITDTAPLDSEADVTLTGDIGTDFIIDNVTLDITHTWDSDLELRLISPAGTSLDLSIANGGGADDYTNTVFQDGGADITAASAPFTGVFEPQGGTFAATFNGESVNGIWTLNILDTFGADDGTLNNFEITFSPPPTCIKPLNLSVDNVTATTVDLSWDAEPTATIGYDYVLITDGSIPDETTTPTGSVVGTGMTTANATGLKSCFCL